MKTYSNQSSLVKDESFILERLKENKFELIKESFLLCEEAVSMSSYEVNFSGTTCVIAILLKNKLIIANAGDSRAVLFFQNNSNSVLTKKILLNRYSYL